MEAGTSAVRSRIEFLNNLLFSEDVRISGIRQCGVIRETGFYRVIFDTLAHISFDRPHFSPMASHFEYVPALRLLLDHYNPPQ